MKEDGITISKEAEARLGYEAGQEVSKHRANPKVTSLPHAQPYIILKDAAGNERVEWLDKVFDVPTQQKGCVRLKDAESFIRYFNAYKGDASAIYATMVPCKFVAVIDEDYTDGDALPNWREFRAEFTPDYSTEKETWWAANRKPFDSTEAFALFLEDNLPDIVEPEGATMLEIALNFRVNQDVRYSSAQRLSDGHIDLGYQNIVEAGATGPAGRIQIPEQFRIEVPIFAGVGAPKYGIDARFRYRLSSGNLKLWYELVRPHKVLETAFTDLWTKVGAETVRQILLGTPE